MSHKFLFPSSDSDSGWYSKNQSEYEENDVSNFQGHPLIENDSSQNQFEQSYDDPENISTSFISYPRRCRKCNTYQHEKYQVQIDEPAQIIMNDKNTSNQQKSNNTRNFPSQMGRLIINDLKNKKKFKKLNLKVPKNMNDINKLINSDIIREDVTKYFEGNQILFDVLSSSKLISPSNVIEGFAPYHNAFKQKMELQNQTW